MVHGAAMKGEIREQGVIPQRRVALTIVGIYAVIGCLWILLSDRVLAIFIADPASITLVQTLKGWAYVLITAGILYGLISHYLGLIQQANSAVAERERQYRIIVETAQEGIWAFDQHFIAVYANQRMAEMLGYSVDEILGRSLFDFMAPEMRDAMAHYLARRRQGANEVYEFRFRRKDGGELWAMVAGTPLYDTQGDFVGAFGMLTDVTERRQTIEYQQEFARKTIAAATEGKLLIMDREEIGRIAGPALAVYPIVHVEDLSAIRQGVTEIARAAGMEDERIFDFLLCISEATTNAYKHAGSGSLSLHQKGEALLVVISDHGPGIPSINLPEVALKRGFTTGMSLGMGYKAMISIAEHVYLATGPGGTTVAIEMPIKAPAPPPREELPVPQMW